MSKEQIIQFLKDNKSLLQKNDLDGLYKKINENGMINNYDLTDFLVNTCKIPVLNYMTIIPPYMFYYMTMPSVIIPSNIKSIDKSAFRRTTIGDLTIYSDTRELLFSSVSADKIEIKENIKNLSPGNFTAKKLILPKSCTRLSNGFDGYDFIIETPYRENQNEKLRVSENDLGWARTHIKFIHDESSSEGENN